MSTSEKLTYLNGTKQALKESINNLGGDITSETTFREYAQELDNIYDNIPKTTGEDTNLSLNTIKGKMNIIPKGDTQQDSATGSNLMNTEKLVNGTYNGLTITKDSDDFINISGTATANTSIVLSEITYNFPSTLYISYENTFATSTAQLTFFNGSTTLGGLTFSGANRTYNMSTMLGGKTCTRIELYITSGNTINGKFRPMLNTQSGQPYSKYAFPNPSFPSDIEVVRGKNRLDDSNLRLFNSNKYISTTDYTTQGKIVLKPNTIYSLVYIKNTMSDFGLWEFDSSNNKTAISGIGNDNGNYRVILFTTLSTTKTMSFYAGGNDIYTSVEKFLQAKELVILEGDYSSQAIPSYLPYNTLEIKERGKNQFSFVNNSSKSRLGLTFTWSDSSITVNGTSMNTETIFGDGVSLKPIEVEGTYKVSGYTRSDTFFQLYWKDKNGTIKYKELKNNPTITFNEGDTLYQLFFFAAKNDILTFNNETFNIMIEKGDTITNFIPYEETTQQLSLGDIELCKIGNYQDYLYKSGDKWYKKEQIGKVVLNGSETIGANAGVFYLSDITNYAISNNIPYCTHFKGIVNVTTGTTSTMANNEIAFRNNNDAYRLYIRIDNISEGNVLKTWLSINKPMLYYALSTSNDIEITNETLIEQLDNLEKLKSYNGTTNISSSGSLPMILNVSAIKGES